VGWRPEVNVELLHGEVVGCSSRVQAQSALSVGFDLVLQCVRVEVRTVAMALQGGSIGL